MKQKLFLLFVFGCFLICGCTANQLKYDKLSERDKPGDDAFYNDCEVYKDVFDDFDVKVRAYNAVYDEKKISLEY